jgi:hypothetical protein
VFGHCGDCDVQQMERLYLLRQFLLISLASLVSLISSGHLECLFSVRDSDRSSLGSFACVAASEFVAAER